MSNYDPKYDEDNIKFGYLKKILGDSIKSLSPNSSIRIPKNYGSIPTTPYYVGDTWNDGKNIYTCSKTREIGNFDINDWKILFDQETNEAISNSFQFLSKVKITKTTDGKIETFYQTDDPSLNWTLEQKLIHIGDYYQNSNNYKTYIYTEECNWEEIIVTTIIFDNITGHRNIFTSRPNDYSSGDIWYINNTNDVELFSNVSLQDFLQARNSNVLFSENDWEKVTNELNLRANLYSIGGIPVSNNNVFSNLQYVSSGKHCGYDVLGFDEYLGIGNDTSGDYNVGYGLYRGYADIAIDIDLPDNFKVVSAFLSVFHTPVYWSYATGGSTFDTWGASKNIKLYKMSNERNIKLLYQNSLTYRWKINSSNLTEIPNAFGATSYSFTNTQNVTIERKDTINLKNYLNSSGKTKLVIRSGDPVPSNASDMAANTGMARAIVNILGYVDLKGSGS